MDRTVLLPLLAVVLIGSVIPSCKAAAVETKPVPAASMSLYNINTSFCANVEGNSTKDGAPVVPGECIANSTGQKWFWSGRALVNQQTGKCLTVKANGRVGALVEQWICNGGANQNWFWTGLGTIQAYSADSGLCLCPPTGSTKQLFLSQCGVAGDQIWASNLTLKSVQTTTATPALLVKVPANASIPVDVSLYNMNTTFCAGVEGNSSKDGAPVVSGECIASSIGQKWFWNGRALVNRQTGKCLTVKANGRVGALVEQWICNGGANQDWFWTGLGAIQAYSADSGLCLYPPTGGTKQLFLSQCGVAGGQIWASNVTLKNVATTTPTPLVKVPVNAFTPADVSLYNINTTFCAGVEGNSTKDGAPVVPGECIANSTGQKWFWNGRALVNRQTGKCLTVKANGRVGALVEQWICNGGANQNWFWTGFGDIQAYSADSGLCLYPPVGSSKQMFLSNCGNESRSAWANVILGNETSAPDSSLKRTVDGISSRPKCGVPWTLVDGGGSSTKVLGGRGAKSGMFPWTVAIVNGSSYQHCGGTIIDDRHILTAAHCLKNLGKKDEFPYNDEDFLKNGNVIVGLVDITDVHLDMQQHIYKVEKVTPHPDFKISDYMEGKNIANDIAVLTLTKPIAGLTADSGPRAICLPSKPPPDNAVCYVAGWGSSYLFNPQLTAQQNMAGDLSAGDPSKTTPGFRSTTLRYTKVDLLPLEDCRRARAAQFPNPDLGDRTVCTMSRNKERGTCDGDSGGGLYCQGSDGVWTVYGVVALDDGCGKAGIPDVYTDIFSVLDFVKREKLTSRGFYIYSPSVKLCAGVNGELANGARLIAEECDRTDISQQWQWNGKTIVNKFSGKCLRMVMGLGKLGPVDQWDCSGDKYQRWFWTGIGLLESMGEDDPFCLYPYADGIKSDILITNGQMPALYSCGFREADIWIQAPFPTFNNVN